MRLSDIQIMIGAVVELSLGAVLDGTGRDGAEWRYLSKEAGVVFARVVTFQGSAERMQQDQSGTSRFRQQVLPVVQAQQGFKGATVLFDRQQGKLIGITYWESAEAAEAVEPALARLRAESAASMGAAMPTTELYEVVDQV